MEKIVLIIIHGSKEHKNRYNEIKIFLQTQNIQVYISDLATHGINLNQEKIHNFSYEEMEKSALNIIDEAIKKYPNHKYVLVGHSMGSFIAKDIVYSNKRSVDALILSGTNNPSKTKIFFANFIIKFGTKTKVNRFNNFILFGLLGIKSKLKGNGKNWLSSNLENEKNVFEDEKCGNDFTNNSLISMLKFISISQDKNILQNFKDKNIPQLIIYGAKDPVSNFGIEINKMLQSQQKFNINNQMVISYPNSKHEIFFDDDFKKVEKDIIIFLNNI